MLPGARRADRQPGQGPARRFGTSGLSNPQEIIVNLWRTAEDAMQGARHDAVRALLVVGNAAARLWWKPEITRIYWGLL